MSNELNRRRYQQLRFHLFHIANNSWRYLNARRNGAEQKTQNHWKRAERNGRKQRWKKRNRSTRISNLELTSSLVTLADSRTPRVPKTVQISCSNMFSNITAKQRSRWKEWGKTANTTAEPASVLTYCFSVGFYLHLMASHSNAFRWLSFKIFVGFYSHSSRFGRRNRIKRKIHMCFRSFSRSAFGVVFYLACK